MNLWRLEWLRLRRTWRGVGPLAVYLFVGLTGPVVARYLSEILERFGTSGVEIRFPEPQPVDGLIQYLGNAQQIGLIVFISAAAGALAVDASPDLATFLRTRISSPAHVILRRYVVWAAFGSTVFVLGALAAWYQTTVLIGALPADAMLLGMLFGSAYYGYLTAVVALAAGIARGVLGAVLITLGLVLVEPLVGLLRPIADWLPGQLSSAMVELAAEEVSPFGLLRPLATATVASAMALWVAIRLSERREM